MNWLKHAFAVDPPGPAEPNDIQCRVVDSLCNEVVRRRLVTPATLILEMGRPLNYVSAQFLHFWQPIVSAVINAAEYEQFSLFLEQRGSIDYISLRLTAIEKQQDGHEKDSKHTTSTQTDIGNRP
jgi:hypothetical protein